MKYINANSGRYEWYTPQRFTESARRVFGGSIDLDPASCEVANEAVKAKTYYTVKDNGLLQPWFGNVWLNPPYNQMKKFSKKILEREYDQLILLCNNATETRWWLALIDIASAVVFHTGRIAFVAPDDRKNTAPLQGQAFLYFGDNPDRFLSEFKEYGWGVKL